MHGLQGRQPALGCHSHASKARNAHGPATMTAAVTATHEVMVGRAFVGAQLGLPLSPACACAEAIRLGCPLEHATALVAEDEVAPAMHRVAAVWGTPASSHPASVDEGGGGPRIERRGRAELGDALWGAERTYT